MVPFFISKDLVNHHPIDTLDSHDVGLFMNLIPRLKKADAKLGNLK